MADITSYMLEIIYDCLPIIFGLVLICYTVSIVSYFIHTCLSDDCSNDDSQNDSTSDNTNQIDSRAKWKRPLFGEYTCSLCGEKTNEKSSFCPNCLAEMK